MTHVQQLLRITAHKWSVEHIRPGLPVLRREADSAARKTAHIQQPADIAAQAQRAGDLGSAGPQRSGNQGAGEGQGTGLCAGKEKEAVTA